MPERSVPEEQAGEGYRPGQSDQASRQSLTDDLVRQVADKVYAMLMQDLTIERERQCPSSRLRGCKGGW